MARPSQQRESGQGGSEVGGVEYRAAKPADRATAGI